MKKFYSNKKEQCYKNIKKTYIHILLFSFLLFTASSVKAQVTTNGSSGLALTYPSLAAAITALNGATITSPVVITLLAANPQTAPAGGYVITAQGTAANTITISGNNNTITASNALTAGALTDALFKFQGADFITLQDFTMRENPANATTTPASNNMTEWGVALFYASATNGSQNNTIQNNTISLNRSYTNTFGIYSNTRHTATVIGTAADITAPTGANSFNKIYGNNISNTNMGIAFIGSNVAANQDVNNDIGGSSLAQGNTISNWGGAAAGSTYVSNSGTSYCIFVNHQNSYNVSYNRITSAAVSGTAVTFRAIVQDYTAGPPTGTFTNNITNNTITMTSGFASGTFTHIAAVSGVNTMTLNITNNTFLNSAITSAGSSTMTGISNTFAINTLNISNNSMRGFTSAATTGGVTGITNNGTITTTININNNQFGDDSNTFITFSAATSGAIFAVNNQAGAGTANCNISNNNIGRIVHSTTGSSTHTYLRNIAATLTQTISNNTFTDITANTSGSVVFISNSVTLSATGSQNINNNSIVTGFNKTATGGTVTFFTTNGSSVTGSVVYSNNNNFSNITVTGTTIIAGWVNTDGAAASAPVKKIINNTFNNIVAGTGSTTIVNVNFGADSIRANTISNISSSGNITCILRGITGTSVIDKNTITGVSSTGAGPIIGIQTNAATSSAIQKNKIGDFQSNNATGTVNGILLSAGTSITASNNIIGDLRAIATNSGSDAVIGINITSSTSSSTVRIYYNTVNLSAISSGANFSTSCIFHVSNLASVASLDMRNNIFVNSSTPKGTGTIVAYRRSATTLTNYANTSNRNLFSAPIIFGDGTNFDATLAAYKARVSGIPADVNSITETPSFLSTSVSSSNFLHIDGSIASSIESGGANIAGFTNDFDDNVRQGNLGYSGSGTAPDIGADEFDNSSLPIELFYFNAKRTNANHVELLWSTASETNNKGFSVERMLEHEQEFSEIAWVDGNGTKFSMTYYSNIDANNYTSNSYYRLKQIDFDGIISYSDIKAVEGSESQSSILTLYPNPVKEELNLHFQQKNNSPTSAIIKILTIDGIILYQTETTIAPYQQIRIDYITQLQPGLYVLNVETTDNEPIIQKFIKQ